MKYFKRLLNWFQEEKYFFVTIIIVWFTSCLDNINFGIELKESILFYGLFLQLLGAFVILITLRQKLILFKGYGLLNLLIKPIKNFPLSTNSKHVTTFANSKGTSSTTANLRDGTPPIPEIPELIRYFNARIDSLQEQFDKNKTDINNEIRNLNNTIENIKSGFENRISQTKQLIVETAVSNPWFELLGIVCVFWGIILGTIPEYIIRILF